MARFRKVLRDRNFLFLWLGQIISQLGDRLGQMALIALVYSRSPGSTWDMAKILSFTILPVFIIGPVAGVYVDRWDRRKTLYICDFIRAILAFFIPFFLGLSNLLPIYLLIFLIIAVGRFFIPAKLAILPELVKKESLLAANSLVNITGMLAAVLGFGASGVLVEWFGVKSGFYLNALSFLISALLIYFIANHKNFSPALDLKQVSREFFSLLRKSVFQEIKEGFVYFIKKEDIRSVSWIMFVLWSALGAVYVVTIVFVQNILGSVTKDLGLLIMFLGAGLFTGSVFYGRFGSRLSHYKTIFFSLSLSGVMLIIFTLILLKLPLFLLAAILTFILGNVVSPIMIASNTIIHKASDNEMMGKVFSSLEIVMHLAFLLFMFLSSLLAEYLAHFVILISVGIIFSIVGVFNLFKKRDIPWLD